jgi:hypothetical protein
MTRTARALAADVAVGDAVTALSSDALRHRVELGDCSGAQNDDWFPPEPEAKSPAARVRYEATARQLCGGCPVRAECLELALRDEARPYVMPHGIFGGLAPWERKKLNRGRRRRAHAVRVRGEIAEVSA